MMRKIVASALGLLCITAAASAAAPSVLTGTGEQASFGVTRGNTGNVAATELPPALPAWWRNGDADGHSALISQDISGDSYRVADDIVFESGKWHIVRTIKVCMAVSINVAAPDAALQIYSDCNGKPGAVLGAPITMPVVTTLPSSPFQALGFKLVQFEFLVADFNFGELDGCERIWISPYGVTPSGYYFWATSGGGATSTSPTTVQGAQAHHIAIPNGISEWTPVSLVPQFERCTDFCFEVTGDVCYTIKDQSEYDLAGVSSIKFPNIQANEARAADNFQISSDYSSVRVCRVEAYLATNCNPARVFGEIYSNVCDEPGILVKKLENPEVIPVPGATFDGLPVFCFRFDAPTGAVLQGGRNYWFSLAATSAGTIFDRAVFLFKKRNDNCLDIHITPGVYKNEFANVIDFAPVEDAAGNSREFAFKIYGAPEGLLASTGRFLPGDANSDGIVNFSDLTWVLLNFGNVDNGQ